MNNKTSKPELWNPNVTASWSLLFTPVFGAWIQASNWKALDENKKASQSTAWFYVSIVFTVIALLFLPDSYGYMPLLLWTIAWYFLSGKSQVKHVKTIEYSKKSWVKPVLIAIGIMVVSLVVLVMIASALNL